MKSKYKRVYIKSGKYWEARLMIKGIQYFKIFDFNQEKNAALYVDLILIKNGKNPINILKRT